MTLIFNTYNQMNPTVIHPYEDSNAIHWQLPPNGSRKFNRSGAFSPSDKRAAFAVFVCDSDGSVVNINYGRIRVSSAQPLQPELGLFALHMHYGSWDQERQSD